MWTGKQFRAFIRQLPGRNFGKYRKGWEDERKAEESDYFDTPYYFWYITLPDVEERLQNIDYGSYTCQELIDALEVQYEKAE